MDDKVKAFGHEWVWCAHLEHRFADGVKCLEQRRVKGGRHCSNYKTCDYIKKEEKNG
jgi:hypothetical protein